MAAVVRYGGTPSIVMERADLLAAILSTLRSDLALVESHRPAAGTRLTCPITAFGGVDDTIDSVSLQAWSEYTAASFRVRMFPGGHFYLSEVGRALVDEIVRDLCPAETLQAPRLAGAAI
jgi:surfactin synthase thioesterase subunit